MILGFKKQFVEKILNGSKIHTIREDCNKRWKSGRSIHFATGTRTKNYNQFKLGNCMSIQLIEIRYKFEGRKTTAEVLIDKVLIGQAIWFNCALKNSSYTIDMLSKNDGFANVNEFFEWFDEDFSGKIIHWTDFKYST